MRDSIFRLLRVLFSTIEYDHPHIQDRCLVLGSAPNPIIPESFNSDWTLITVNASQASLTCTGFNRIPDITVMSGEMLGTNPANVAGKIAIQNMATKCLILIIKNISLEECISTLESIGYKFEKLIILSNLQRAIISYKELKINIFKKHGIFNFSTGIFAAVYAHSIGAKKIVLSGISLSPGHAYNDFGHKRHHIDGDINALISAYRKQVPLYVTDLELMNITHLQTADKI